MSTLEGHDAIEGKLVHGSLWKRLFLWLCLVLGSNYLVLQYYVDWHSILPFTNTPSDYVLLIGIIVSMRYVRAFGIQGAIAPFVRIRWQILVLLLLVGASFFRSLGEQGVLLSLLSHRGWAYAVFLLVGYYGIDGEFTFTNMIRALSLFSVFAGLGAIFYALTFQPGVLSRYFPMVIPLSGVFVLYHGIRLLRDHESAQKWPLVFHLVVVILSQTRSLWITCLVGLIVAALALRKQIHYGRLAVQFTIVGLLLAGIFFSGMFDIASRALTSRLTIGLEDVEQEKGSYALRVFSFLDALDYINEEGSSAVLFGVSDLHWQSAKMLSLVGYGRVMGYAGITYSYLGVEETAYMENSVANMLLTFGVIGSLCIWFLVYYPLVLGLLRGAVRVFDMDRVSSAFLLAFGAFMCGQPVQYFFGVELKGLELGLLFGLVGATQRIVESLPQSVRSGQPQLGRDRHSLT